MTSPDIRMRVGEGWDTHALVPGRALVIGGVPIPFHLGLMGHSDADVLLHAITDALLGAAGLGDIGTHFPDIVNIDSTVVAQSPRLATHIAAMRERIGSALQLDAACVNVKAKTAERMGPVGQGQSIEARAVALLTG